MIRKMVHRGLQKQGFRTIEADTTEQLINIYKSEKVDMFIISQEFKEITGREIIRNLRKNFEYKKTPVIMLSSRDSKLDYRKNKSAGVNDFISKPFQMDKLLVCVEKNLAKYRLLKEKEAMGLYISDAAKNNAKKIANSDTKLTMTACREFKTIMFADIVGFTPVCEKLPAENVISVLNEYFDNIVQIINRNCGTLDKFIGDAVMAYFGGKENGALMAVNAAIEMLNYLKNADNPVCRKIKIRIGINSGEVIAGDIGSRFSRRDYTLIGDNVNTAQRLESAAPPNSILISESTYSLVQDNIESEPQPAIKLKGKDKEVQVYLLKAIKNLIH
jgi:class 3 adenylate cyclase